MAKHKYPFPPASIGSCYAVPVDRGGFALVVVAATSGKGSTFGYFYGPRQNDANNFIPLMPRGVAQASLVGMFGDLGICKGEWRLLGTMPDFDINEWPILPCVRRDELAEIAFISYYNRDLSLHKEERVSIDSPKIVGLPLDRLMGYGSAQSHLARVV